MSIISVTLAAEHVAKADAIARMLSACYGVPVSRSEIIRRMIVAFPMPVDARALLNAALPPAGDHPSPADPPPLDPPPRES